MIFWRFDDDVEIIIWKTDESVDETLLFFAPEIQEVHREKLESIKYEKRRKEYLCARLLIDIIAGIIGLLILLPTALRCECYSF